MSRSAGSRTQGSAEEQARQAASDFVAAALVEPVFKQLRESNHSAAPFAPGPAEKQFGSMLDVQYARRLTRSANFPLVDRLAQFLLKKGAAPVAGAVS